MNTKLLKQKILDLAIRGKLVPQDPNDEPASELLKRIRAEKEKLIAEGKIKRSKNTMDKPHYENVPFEVPESWEWTTIKEISSSILYGVSESAKAKGAYKLLRITDIQDNKVDWNSVPYTDFDSVKARVYLLQNDDILFARTGATVGKSYLVKGLSEQSIFASYLIRVQASREILPCYIKFYFESGYYWSQISDSSVGTGQPNVNGTLLGELKIPIPPYLEQLRIVSEIEKWFTLIDVIDQNKVDLQEAIKTIKSKILDLSIHGKLVPQDSNDEPAVELLKRINPNAPICDTSHYGNLPESWCICKLKDVFDITMGSSPIGDSLNSKHEGIEFHQGKLCFSELYLNKSEIYTDSPTKLAEKHSILLCVRAPVGVINITERKICIGRGLCSLKPKNGIDFMFAFYALQTHKSHFEANATGTTFKAIGGDTIRNEIFALPPYDEQVRIRQKIESLFSELNTISADL